MSDPEQPLADRLCLGVDIGQKRDPTAVCVVEVKSRTDDRQTERHFFVRYLQRLPLGTPYPEVARRVAEVARRVGERAGEVPRLYVDATGVGAPVVDLLQEVAWRTATVVPVYLTAGDQQRQDGENGQSPILLGKERLVRRLQALLKTGRLHLPSNPETQALAAELLSYEQRVNEKGHARYGAFKTGTHDDLATALGLAVLGPSRPGPR